MKRLTLYSILWKYFTGLALVVAFKPQLHRTKRPVASLFTSLDTQEFDEDKRMEMVRKLQKSFYSSDETEKARPELQENSGIMTNLPLWRVGWVEVPGRANCLNVHEGQYTHMFETIVSGPKPWYFGHLNLPGGFKMTRTGQPRFELKSWKDELSDENRVKEPERSAVVGVLMRITDYRRLEDGRLIILVHALERFVVSNVIQSFPFSVADVQILPDVEELPDQVDENFCKIARAVAVKKLLQYHSYENRNVELPLPRDVEYLSTKGISEFNISKVLPFSFYSDNDTLLNGIEEGRSFPESLGFSGGQPTLEKVLENGLILQKPPFLLSGASGKRRKIQDLAAVETLVWLALEDLCRNTGFVLPEEILTLLPSELDYLDMGKPKQYLSPKYPALRRQWRLSYTVPALLENTPVGANMRQVLLNTPSTQTRLAAVLEQLDLINEKLMGKFE